MLKTYRIIPLAFILFFFGFTFSTVSPLFAQTLDQLIERVEKLEAFHAGQTVPPVVEQPTLPPVVEQPTLTPVPSKIDGPWDKSMGMRHPARPCMVKGPGRDGTGLGPRGCGPDRRSPEQIASDPYDTNNPASQAAHAPAAPRGKPSKCRGERAMGDQCEVLEDAARMLRHKGLR